jgi:hypothetical protein
LARKRRRALLPMATPFSWPTTPRMVRTRRSTATCPMTR